MTAMMRNHKLFWTLLFFIILFLLLDWFSLPNESLHRFLDVNQEANIPTWFSSILLFMVSLTAFGVFYFAELPAGWFYRYIWLILSIAYLYFSLDEIAGFHEFTIKMIERKTYRWVYLYFPFALALFTYCLTYFMLHQRKQMGGPWPWILIGMMVAGAGGLGVEYLQRLLLVDDVSSVVRHLSILLEEGMEMAGTALIFEGCRLELARVFSEHYAIISHEK